MESLFERIPVGAGFW